MHDPQRTGPYDPDAPNTPSLCSAPTEALHRIGRYQITRVLGEGGFGRVHLAYDEMLNRQVAIKVPHRWLISRPQAAQEYLAEAQNVARLDHPHIVPVFDVGSTDDCPCFIVSKYVEGRTLSQRMRESRPTMREASELIAMVAEALHHAHRRGLVHRDIKPGNILIEKSGHPYVTDFGLALKDENVGTGPGNVGTLSYMSPEQARGEGHRVDGRSDIFSLGVVFYELLAGRRPFRSDDKMGLAEQITTFEPRPLRQIDEDIPKELERICFKALSKRAAERFMTARDMADDLRHYLDQLSQSAQLAPAEYQKVDSTHSFVPPGTGPSPSAVSAGSTPASATETEAIKIVPKGLRSFDAHDADFMLELLPGPRDREGLPESIRFWKVRIESDDPSETFSVGLIYGPSGCGKSSLVKAGLLPRLRGDVITLYLEASANETEQSLLNGLRRRFPDLASLANLQECLAALRGGRGLPHEEKLLIILDQFEQWLHGKRGERKTELLQALRQCDGGRLKCILMVRDDFWMATTRFMQELEIDLLPGRNLAAVDLFDLRHARKVLTALGRAFEALPASPAEPTKEQKAFLDQAVSGLAEEDKIICVRLALFAEMMKGKPWTVAALKEVGGTEGVGETFLEETFSSPNANPKYRLHQRAARLVCQALLPEAGADIKGHMRSRAELLEVSGYAGKPKDFDDLIRVLDTEIRLITPTESAAKEAGDKEKNQSDSSGADSSIIIPPSSSVCYQLTHDYLVPSLRAWLSRKQKETRRGRAEILLEDRASVWNARPENRQLPSLTQWAEILVLTEKKDWSGPARKMMRSAARLHAARGTFLVALLFAGLLIGLGVRHRLLEKERADRAAGLVRQLQVAHIAQVPDIIKELEGYRTWANPLLQEAHAEAPEKSRQKLNTSLALLAIDPNLADYLRECLMDAQPEDLPVIRDALAGYSQAVLEPLWKIAEGTAPGQEREALRAASALAKYDPDSPHWSNVRKRVAEDLVKEPIVYLTLWMEFLRPVRVKLLEPLAAIYRDPKRRETERDLATEILGDYAADQPQVLAELLMDADIEQFKALFPKCDALGNQGLALFETELSTSCPANASEDAREKLARRQANAAVALLLKNHAESAWPVLRYRPDPRARAYLIHRLSALGADPVTLCDRLGSEPDVGIQRALILSLGEYEESDLESDRHDQMVVRLQNMYQNAPDAGLHACSQWLLRRWKQDAWLEQMAKEWASDDSKRNQKVEEIRRELKSQSTTDSSGVRTRWYMNSQGQTMVVVPGPVEFAMASLANAGQRVTQERLQNERIGYSFAVASHLVTVEQFRRFRPDFHYMESVAPTGTCPVNQVTWYEAAEYCNRLSRLEKLTECYLPNSKGQYAEGMQIAKDYLKRTGYRLATEREWEAACRAGTRTSRYYGESNELLEKYAWHLTLTNSDYRSIPVGTLKPNDWGLFDMHGNLYTWCLNHAPAPSALEFPPDVSEGGVEVRDKDSRVIRGSAFEDVANDVRTRTRNKTVPGYQDKFIGLRVARTFP